MKIDQKDIKYLNALHVKSCLDLALIIPISHDDTSILNKPLNDSFGACEVNILSLINKGKFLQITAYVSLWQVHVKLVIFNYMPYHFKIFKPKSTLYILGKVQNSGHQISILQPKVITKINQITPKYKTSLKNISVQNLISKYITFQNLQKTNLPLRYINTLLSLHANDKNSIQILKLQSTIDDLKYIEIFNYLKKLSKKKIYFKSSHVLCGDESEFIASLPFTLTTDQKNAIKDIKNDLQKQTAAKRVIMGDVGSGKTIIILASVMLAYPKKSILMAPTTILANQLYEEAKKYLPLHVNTTLVQSKSKEIDLNEFDFIIGTHALLYKNLPKCDLVMIDEQHRFGTNQRNLISKLCAYDNAKAHFLQFTATPIPRTLSMINSSVIDYSFLKQTPFKKDISTFIIDKSNFKSLLNHINEQIKMKHQIIIIYPLVNESEHISYQSLEQGREFWEKNYKNVYVTHGKDKSKEQILKSFSENGDILLSTTVVEVGISLPKLSTIIIVGGERLGLASLHQLRGRVSRVGLKGYCFIFTHANNSQRLYDFAKTNNGFDIAMLDLKYRQSGDLLNGLVQHGMTFKWYDMEEDIVALAKKDLEEIPPK